MSSTIKAIAFAVAILTTACDAEDGRIFSAKPPIVVRRDVETVNYYFTNTSDKTLHGVKINSVKDGQPTSVVIIDTIEPHKTVAVEFSRMLASAAGSFRDVTITCTNYSSPIKLIP